MNTMCLYSMGKSHTIWSKTLDGMDVVVHLAARVHVIDDKFKDPLHAYRTVNVAGTECIAQAAVAVVIKCFVYLSSVKVNGERTEGKIRGQMSAIQVNGLVISIP
jgi:UDP-glucose 4-epimerase